MRDMHANGMTQAQIAEATGMKQSSVSEYINGEYTRAEYTQGLRILAAHKAAMRKARSKAAPEAA